MYQLRRSIGWACVLAVMVMAMIVGGCQKKAEDKPTVALVMKSLANEFFKTMEDGARAHHAQHEAEYDLQTRGILRGF